MSVRSYLQEQSALAEKRADGSYPVVIITEGVGSSGVYSAELIESSVQVFEGVPSFINHPINADAPHERDLNTIAGRISGVTVGEGEHGKQLEGYFTPRSEYASLFEEFADIIGLSIFCGGYGEKDESGRIVVESFDGEDPYRSVDAVVAAGRGGRFKRAQESLRAIESSLGSPDGTKPGSTSAPDSANKQEVHMERKEMEEILTEALAAALAPVTTYFTNEETRRQAEADAAADKGDVKDAVEAAVAAVEAVKAAKVLPSFESKLIESAKTGADIAEDLEFAKKVTAEAAAPAKNENEPSFTIHESAQAGADEDFSLNLGGH